MQHKSLSNEVTCSNWWRTPSADYLPESTPKELVLSKEDRAHQRLVRLLEERIEQDIFHFVVDSPWEISHPVRKRTVEKRWPDTLFHEPFERKPTND